MASASRLAKLSVPRASGALVRPRLHQLLDDLVLRAAVWIAAGPGAGKSTLAASWSATRPGRVLWFRADEGDADPAAAFGYFRELARTVRRGAALPA
jgi:ATP/maltotriose-dependent transcriptional regulator MalT